MRKGHIMADEYQDLGRAYLVVKSGGILDIYVADSNISDQELALAKIVAQKRAENIGAVVVAVPIVARYDGR